LETIAEEADCHLICQDDNIYSHPLPMPELDLKTFYEHMHLEDGRTIKFVKFSLG
jgi:tRNA (guanine-N7-)-methyltransferase